MEIETKQKKAKLKWPKAFIKSTQEYFTKRAGKVDPDTKELITDVSTIIPSLKIVSNFLKKHLYGKLLLVEKKERKLHKKFLSGLSVILKALLTINVDKLSKQTYNDLFLGLFTLLPYISEVSDVTRILDILKKLLSSPHVETLTPGKGVKLALGFLKEASKLDPMYVANMLSDEFRSKQTLPFYIKDDLKIIPEMFEYMKSFSKKRKNKAATKKGKINHLHLIRLLQKRYADHPELKFKASDPKVMYQAWTLTNLADINYIKFETFEFYNSIQIFYEISKILFSKKSVAVIPPADLAKKISDISRGFLQALGGFLHFEDALNYYKSLIRETHFLLKKYTKEQTETFVKQIVEDQIANLSLVAKIKSKKDGEIDYSDIGSFNYPECFFAFLSSAKIICSLVNNPQATCAFDSFDDEFITKLLGYLCNLLIVQKNRVVKELEFNSLLNEDLKNLCSYINARREPLKKEVKKKFLGEILPCLLVDVDAMVGEFFMEVYDNDLFSQKSIYKIPESILAFVSTSVILPGEEQECLVMLEEEGFLAKLLKYMQEYDDFDVSYFVLVIFARLMMRFRSNSDLLKEYFTKKYDFINILLNHRLNEDNSQDLLWNAEIDEIFIYQLYGTIVFSLHPTEDRALIDKILKNIQYTWGKVFFQSVDDELNKFSFRFYAFIKQCPVDHPKFGEQFLQILFENYEKNALENIKLLKSNPIDALYNQWEERKNLEVPLEALHLIMHCISESFNTEVFVKLLAKEPMVAAKDLKKFIELYQMIIQHVSRAFNYPNRYVRRTLSKSMLTSSCSVFALTLFPLIQYLENRRSVVKDLPTGAKEIIEQLIFGTLVIYSQSYNIQSKTPQGQNEDETRIKEEKNQADYIKYKEQTLDEFIRKTVVPVLFVEANEEVSVSNILSKFTAFWIEGFPDKYESTVGLGVLILKILNAIDLGFNFSSTLETLNLVTHLLYLFNQQPDKSFDFGHLKALFKEVIDKDADLFARVLERVIEQSSIRKLLDPNQMVEEGLKVTLKPSFGYANEGELLVKSKLAVPELKCLSELFNIITEEFELIPKVDLRKSASVLSLFAKIFNETPESTLFFCAEAELFAKLFKVVVKKLEEFDEKFFTLMIGLFENIFAELLERIAYPDNYIITIVSRHTIAELLTAIETSFSTYHKSLIEVQSKFQKIKNIQTFAQIFNENAKYFKNDHIVRTGFVEFEILRLKMLKYWAQQVTEISLDIMYYFPNYYNFIFEHLDVFSISLPGAIPPKRVIHSLFVNKDAANSIRRKPLLQFNGGELVINPPERSAEEEEEDEHSPSRLHAIRRARLRRRRMINLRRGGLFSGRATGRSGRTQSLAAILRSNAPNNFTASNRMDEESRSRSGSRGGEGDEEEEKMDLENGEEEEKDEENGMDEDEENKEGEEDEGDSNGENHQNGLKKLESGFDYEHMDEEYDEEGEVEMGEEDEGDYPMEEDEEGLEGSKGHNDERGESENGEPALNGLRRRLSAGFRGDSRNESLLQDSDRKGGRLQRQGTLKRKGTGKLEGTHSARKDGEEEGEGQTIQFSKEEGEMQEGARETEIVTEKNNDFEASRLDSGRQEDGENDLPAEFKDNLDENTLKKLDENLKKRSQYADVTLTYDKFFASLSAEIRKEIKQRKPEDLVTEKELAEMRNQRTTEGKEEQKIKFLNERDDSEDEEERKNAEEEEEEVKNIDPDAQLDEKMKKAQLIKILKSDEAKDFLDIAKQEAQKFRSECFRFKYDLYERLITLIRFSEDATGQIVIRYPSEFVKWLCKDSEISLYFIKVLTSLVLIDHQNAKALLDKSVFAEEDSPFRAVFQAPLNSSSLKTHVFHILSDIVNKTNAGLFFMPANEVLHFQEKELKDFKNLRKYLGEVGTDILFSHIMQIFLSSKDMMMKGAGINYGVMLALKIFGYPTESHDERARKYLEDQNVVFEHILTMVIDKSYLLGNLVTDLKSKKDYRLIQIFLEKVFKFALHMIELLNQIFPVFKHMNSKTQFFYNFNTFNKLMKNFSSITEFFLKIFEILNDEFEKKSDFAATREYAVDNFMNFFQNDALANFMSELNKFLEQSDGKVVESLRNISFEDLILIPIYLVSGKLMLASQKVTKQPVRAATMQLARLASTIEEDTSEDITIEDVVRGENEKTRALIDNMMLLVKKHGKSTSSVFLTKITEHFINNQTVLRLVRGLVPYEEKVKFFKSRLYLYMNQDYNEIEITRKDIFKTSFEKINKMTDDELKGEFSIVFVGEDAIDAGGPAREWFTALSKEFVNPKNELFIQMDNNQVYQPKPAQDISEEKLAQYEFVGKILGKAIMSENEYFINCYFVRPFYKHLLGSQITLQDVNHFDPKFYEGIVCLLNNDVTDLGLTFSFEDSSSGTRRVIDMVPNGSLIPVTEENKKEYLRRLCYFITTQNVEKQMQAIVRGFKKIVPKQAINLFNPSEFELLLSGLPDYDVEDMRINAKYDGYHDESPVIKWFWDILRDFDKTQKANFLQFVTGSSKAPLEGFKAKPITICKLSAGTDQYLPTAHTCQYVLDLPAYSSKEILSKKLTLVISEYQEGFGFA